MEDLDVNFFSSYDVSTGTLDFFDSCERRKNLFTLSKNNQYNSYFKERILILDRITDECSHINAEIVQIALRNFGIFSDITYSLEKAFIKSLQYDYKYIIVDIFKFQKEYANFIEILEEISLNKQEKSAQIIFYSDQLDASSSITSRVKIVDRWSKKQSLSMLCENITDSIVLPLMKQSEKMKKESNLQYTEPSPM